MFNIFNFNISIPNFNISIPKFQLPKFGKLGKKIKNLFTFIRNISRDISKDKYRRLGDRCRRERDYDKAYFYYEVSLREGNLETIIPLADLYLAKWLHIGLHPRGLEPIIKDAMSKGFDDPILEYFLRQIEGAMQEYNRIELDGIDLPF